MDQLARLARRKAGLRLNQLQCLFLLPESDQFNDSVLNGFGLGKSGEKMTEPLRSARNRSEDVWIGVF